LTIWRFVPPVRWSSTDGRIGAETSQKSPLFFVTQPGVKLIVNSSITHPIDRIVCFLFVLDGVEALGLHLANGRILAGLTGAEECGCNGSKRGRASDEITE
jgi:hypothetical protein